MRPKETSSQRRERRRRRYEKDLRACGRKRKLGEVEAKVKADLIRTQGRSRSDLAMTAYQCSICRSWHIGHNWHAARAEIKRRHLAQESQD